MPISELGASQEATAQQRNLEKRYYSRSTQLLDDLHVLSESLSAIKADRILKFDVVPVVRKIQSFGFHLMALDVRQNSKFQRCSHGAVAGCSGGGRR